MELRELRRHLLYALPIGESVEYGGYQIERTAHSLLLHHAGSKSLRCPHKGNYARVCEWALGVVGQVETTSPKPGYDPADPPRQSIRDFIACYMAEHHVAPTTREIGEACCLSQSGVRYQIQKLAEAGCLRRIPRQARGIFLKDGAA